MDKSRIGQKAYEFVEVNYNYKPNTEKVYTIVKEDGMYYTIKDEQGNTKEVEYWKVLIAPKKELGEIDMISQYLSDNGVYNDIWKKGSIIVVSIDWGDWKHEHLWCKTAMGYLGYKEIGSSITDENGSDCYSADHYFQYFEGEETIKTR